VKKSTLIILAIIGALILLGGGGYAVYSMVRGIRNNNPGNIRHSSDRWQGLAPQQTDPAFFQFSDAVYGIRAMANILLNYVARDGVPSNVQSIISRWSATDQSAYITDVSNALGVNPTDPIDLAAVLPQMIAAMIQQENGVQPYSMDTIQNGIALV
jgi:hypothetical protein